MAVNVKDLINKVPANERSAFSAKVAKVSANIGVQPKDLMAIMDLESAGTFDPAIQNSLGYTGLIQFGKAAAKELGTTTDALKKMTRVQQMDYVEKYYKMWMKTLGIKKLNDFVDMYLIVFYPTGVKEKDPNKPFSTDKVEAANKSLRDSKGNITKNSIRAVYERKYQGLFDKAIQLASENKVATGASILFFIGIVILLIYLLKKSGGKVSVA